LALIFIEREHRHILQHRFVHTILKGTLMSGIQSVRLVLAVLSIGFAFLLQGTTALRAQILNSGPVRITSANAYDGANNLPLGANFSFLNSTGNNNSAASHVDLTMLGDWDYKLSRNLGLGDASTYDYLPFSVGNLPAWFSKFQLKWNAKWGHGGGSTAVPNSTSDQPSEYIFDRWEPNDATGHVFFGTPPHVYGSSYTIADTANVDSPSQLIVTTSSMCRLETTVNANFDSGTFNTAVAAVVAFTRELGGTVSSSSLAGY
jgi:hypothetical protein